jgi:hypothetical protein
MPQFSPQWQRYVAIEERTTNTKRKHLRPGRFADGSVPALSNAQS